jgi:L-2-hydroxycarboxylate dehydrogenase (NAD+)
MAQEDVLVSADALLDLTARALRKVGVPAEDAAVTADILVATDLWGVESHGVAHLKDFYVGAIGRGEINPRPNITIVSETLATARMDGDSGLGFVVGHRAMGEAMRRAEQVGAGLVSVGNSTHCGAGFYYARMALARDMIGLFMTTGGNVVIPPGGARRAYGANVISVAAPAGDAAPFVLDMATSAVAAGKFEIALRRGMSVPEGWGLDADGHATTDALSFFKGGGLLPLGGTPEQGAYKGFGLALVVDIMCGLLSGFGASIRRQKGFSHFCAAARVEAFLPVDEFKRSMDEMVRALKAAPRAEGADELRIAGERERRLAEERRASGVPLHPAVVASLRSMCEELEIEYGL